MPTLPRRPLHAPPVRAPLRAALRAPRFPPLPRAGRLALQSSACAALLVLAAAVVARLLVAPVDGRARRAGGQAVQDGEPRRRAPALDRGLETFMQASMFL